MLRANYETKSGARWSRGDFRTAYELQEWLKRQRREVVVLLGSGPDNQIGGVQDGYQLNDGNRTRWRWWLDYNAAQNALGSTGAWRDTEDGDEVYCPDAAPRCRHCEDYGMWIGEDSEVEPCPHCWDKGIVQYDPTVDGVPQPNEVPA